MMWVLAITGGLFWLAMAGYGMFALYEKYVAADKRLGKWICKVESRLNELETPPSPPGRPTP